MKVLIPVRGKALDVSEPADLTALPPAFERTIQTCELLVTYAVGVAGKPSRQ